MWLLAYGPAILGVLCYRRWEFWRWVVAMFAWQAAAAFLFASHGTPDHPEGDGLIIRAIIRATNNGPEVAAVGVVFLVAFYVGVVILVNAMRRAASAPRLDDGETGNASNGRKGLELVGLTLLLLAMIYLSPREAPPTLQLKSEEGAVLDEITATLNADLPKKLDDVTTLVGVSRSGTTLIYDYKVNQPRPTAEAFADDFRAVLAPEVCKAQKHTLASGFSYRYRYVFSGNPQPLDFLVDRAECAPL
ncbi:hypothetical protein M9M90_03965 [Phenylobacterium sp. LH3H17]|uniref:hypothetical protein n=1 Tax=Phenylobacterium sp. LH3H17 TaxID=2903901 RepID=UPI0020CA1C66|nr:hypothetical protein [Phenylobacterium sp. LH3H17]UTP40343.1 hypothetical protein M9M90_03965 [Phenylobacterium sp. LH3H17]